MIESSYKHNPAPLRYGEYYHIYNRGINGTNIFPRKYNYQYFLNKLQKTLLPTNEILAYCLLRNHFHILIKVMSWDEIQHWASQTLPEIDDMALNEKGDFDLETYQILKARILNTKKLLASSEVAQKNYPSRVISNFCSGYTQAFNKTEERTGSLFERPFGRVLIEGENHLATNVVYIHRNPIKHGFTTDISSWPYSSYHGYVSPKPSFLNKATILNWFGNQQNFEQSHHV